MNGPKWKRLAASAKVKAHAASRALLRTSLDTGLRVIVRCAATSVAVPGLMILVNRHHFTVTFSRHLGRFVYRGKRDSMRPCSSDSENVVNPTAGGEVVGKGRGPRPDTRVNRFCAGGESRIRELIGGPQEIGRFGPNFQFSAVPEPSGLVLLGTGSRLTPGHRLSRAPGCDAELARDEGGLL